MPTIGELMKSVSSHGSLSQLLMMKAIMVCYYMRDSHKVMTALIFVLPLIQVAAEFSLQFQTYV